MALFGLTTDKEASKKMEESQNAYKAEVERQLKNFGVKDDKQIAQFFAEVEKGLSAPKTPAESGKGAENKEDEKKDVKEEETKAGAGEAQKPEQTNPVAEAKSQSDFEQRLLDQKNTIEGQAAKISALEEQLGKIIPILEKIGVKSDDGKVAVGSTPSPEAKVQTSEEDYYRKRQKELGRQD